MVEVVVTSVAVYGSVWGLGWWRWLEVASGGGNGVRSAGVRDELGDT